MQPCSQITSLSARGPRPVAGSLAITGSLHTCACRSISLQYVHSGLKNTRHFQLCSANHGGFNYSAGENFGGLLRAVDARAFIRRVVSFCGSRDGQGHPRPCHWPGPPLTLSSGFYFSFFSGHTIQTLMSKAGRNATTELANLLYLLSTLVLIAEADCGNTWPHLRVTCVLSLSNTAAHTRFLFSNFLFQFFENLARFETRL